MGGVGFRVLGGLGSRVWAWGFRFRVCGFWIRVSILSGRRALQAQRESYNGL